MNLILNIDTSNEVANVSISAEGRILALSENRVQKEHASFVHTEVVALLASLGRHLKDLSAVAITHGPGSYTGIRVGMAAAKGFCYALHIPLITISALEVIANASLNTKYGDCFYIPLIDARRDEVFTCIYDHSLHLIQSPSVLMLSPNVFSEILLKNKVVFSGSGVNKFKKIINYPSAIFSEDGDNATSMSLLSFQSFKAGKFADIQNSDPLYLKDVYIIPSKSVNH